MYRIHLLLLSLPFLAVSQDYENPLWMRYPALSPDGQTIVLSYQGDLYSVPSSGGEAVPLTLHEAHDYHPVWSPDGQQVAFASDRFGNFDVYLMPARGGRAERLTYHSAHDHPSGFGSDSQSVLFTSSRTPSAESALFPYGRFNQLYQIPTTGGQPTQKLSLPMNHAHPSSSGDRILYQDLKGYEDIWRKHHTSSIARDIWLYDANSGEHTQLTTFTGEDRNAWWSADEQSAYYLSEESGSFNVWKMNVDNPAQKTQLTNFDLHPVRFLSVADDGTLCFGYHGEIYTMNEGEQPQKVSINIRTDDKYNARRLETFTSKATEMALSPNGEEIALVVRGEIFVTDVESGLTKRVTNTPEQERSISFSPDGQKILYASERDSSWNLYETRIARDEEPYFYAATVLEETPILETKAETFQPAYSPDGKEVAFLEERTTLKVINLESKGVRTILPGDKNYSYSDGDQWYQWSPDGKWFLAQFLDRGRWIPEVGLIAASGESEITNLTNSGYADVLPKWQMDGEVAVWFTDRSGMRSHGSWGSQDDVYAMFFDPAAWEKFNLSKEEYALLKEKEKEKKEDSEEKDEKDKKEKEVTDPINIKLEDIEDRTARLTIHSSSLADALLSPDGEKLYYMSSFEKGHDVWVTDLRERSTEILVKLNQRGGQLAMDKEGKNLFVLNGGKITKVDIEKKNKKPVTFKADMQLKPLAEREYLYEHMWRQVLKKFYVKDLHNVGWDSLKVAYAQFLPHINNNYDFAEMMSELLGELNASHTGCRYYPDTEGADETASLAVFYDEAYEGDGLKIQEIMDKSPLADPEYNIQAGHVIEKIDGETISAGMNIAPLLNHKKDQFTLLSMYNPDENQRWDVRVKPVSTGRESELLYERWVKQRRTETEQLSDGKIGYVHVRGMNDASFREVFSELLGRYSDKESVVIDTRFNGGGWLHDDLVTFLNGREYMTFLPRGQKIGAEPQFKWTRPSSVIMGEGNYSDAHMFPFAYKALGIGETVGMPVPGTGTAVWWERQIDPSLVFGIPQVGMVDTDGNFLENQQLEPDHLVKNDPKPVLEGEDQQLKKAVEILYQPTDIPMGK
ncbi:S41 family peptidase [Tunicatimonas pelagia]|uniref:S41 family peptidase n=1 Tax=Tunicatimonas pelagia TaxID=931531 RepID=UPI002666CBC4|nr:S41 family peptidase [Tunicatimonas pelagia]WKN41672.1 S41 family peptidase [Tunicatimonas pelagia]